MKCNKTVYLLIYTMLLVSPVSHANEEFYGTLESRPEGDTGTWVVNGRKVDVTENTRLAEEHGALVVGACVEVEYKGDDVKKIKSEEKRKCKR